MLPKTLITEGWFPVCKEYPNIDRLVLDKINFKYSIRELEIISLSITNLERIYGSFINPIYVTGVCDTKGSLIPFFIERRKVETLQDLINLVKNQTSVIL